MLEDTMKSGVIESDRKIEARPSIHRRRMSKNAPIVNGAEDNASYSTQEESMVRQVNLAAAFHDHSISCTKSTDLGKSPETKEGRVNLPCETDHIYANCSLEKSKGHTMVTVPSNNSNVGVVRPDNSDEVRQLQMIILCQLNLIQRQQVKLSENEQELKHLNQNHDKVFKKHEFDSKWILTEKNKQPKVNELTAPILKDIEEHKVSFTPQKMKIGNSKLKTRLEQTEQRRDRKRRYTKSDDESTDNLSDVVSGMSESLREDTVVGSSTGNLFTQPGQSLTSPSRALKSRYLGQPKSAPSSPSTASLSSASTSETQEEEKTIDTKTVDMINIPPAPSAPYVKNLKKTPKKRGRKSLLPSRKDDFLQTDKPYYLSDSYVMSSSPPDTETIIDVPSWRCRPVTSFYKMENAEDINDNVFIQRHLKFERAEKQRKRWEMQRFKQQANNQKLKLKKNSGVTKDSKVRLRRKISTFFPNPNNIEYLEVYDSLPVLAFGHRIPLFQPCEFSLPWFVPDHREDFSLAKARKHRSSSCAHKVT